MLSHGTELPDDVEALKELLRSANSKINLLSSEVQVLQERVNLLNARLFGKKSEKLSQFDSLQARLFNEIEAINYSGIQLDLESAERKISVPAHDRKKSGRRPIPEEFPREEIIIDIPEEEKLCACGSHKDRIGEEVSEKLDAIPQRIFVRRTVRPKYACRKCKGVDDDGPVVAIAPVPPCITGKSILAPGIFGRMIASKFEDALPFNRQEKIFARSGIYISRTTMTELATNCYKILLPLKNIFEEMILRAYLIGMDETTTQVLKESGRKASSKSYIWLFRAVLQRDGPLLYYRYEETRSPKFLNNVLGGYSGILQTDGYGGYDAIGSKPGIIHAGCMAHARRMFIDAEKASKGDETIAKIVCIIKHLYIIEDEAKREKFSHAEIRSVRQEKSQLLMEELHVICLNLSERVNRSGYLGKAVHYTLGQWKKLICFLDDGRIPIDNNLVENGIRPYVIGRKNWLFSVSPAGAHASAFYYSLINTAKAQGLNPEEYIVRLFEMAPLAVTDEDWNKLMPLKKNWPDLQARILTIDCVV